MNQNLFLHNNSYLRHITLMNQEKDRYNPGLSRCALYQKYVIRHWFAILKLTINKLIGIITDTVCTKNQDGQKQECI